MLFFCLTSSVLPPRLHENVIQCSQLSAITPAAVIGAVNELELDNERLHLLPSLLVLLHLLHLCYQ